MASISTSSRRRIVPAELVVRRTLDTLRIFPLPCNLGHKIRAVSCIGVRTDAPIANRTPDAHGKGLTMASDEQKMTFVPSRPLPAARTGLLTGFDPGTRTLEAGFQIAPQFRSIPVDIVFEKDIAVQLRDGVTIHVDVFRPAGAQQVPVIVAWR